MRRDRIGHDYALAMAEALAELREALHTHPPLSGPMASMKADLAAADEWLGRCGEEDLRMEPGRIIMRLATRLQAVLNLK